MVSTPKCVRPNSYHHGSDKWNASNDMAGSKGAVKDAVLHGLRHRNKCKQNYMSTQVSTCHETNSINKTSSSRKLFVNICTTTPMAQSILGTGISVPRSSTVPGNRRSRISLADLAIVPVPFLHLWRERCRNCSRGGVRGGAPGNQFG